MRLKKIKYILSFALVLSSLSVNAYAYTNNVDNGISTLGIIGDSVVIDKGDSNGGTVLPPEEELGNENIGTWDDEDKNSSPDAEVPIRKGSIKISLPDTTEKLDKGNVKFSLSKVADIVKGKYEITENYKSVDVDLNELKSSNDLDIAANLFKKVAKTETTLVTNSNGVCSIEDLDVGVYLVYASDIANYENITPFLISIPVWNDVDKTMSFDVEVIPKHTPLPKEEPDKSKAPSTAYNGGGDIFGVLSGISLIAGTGMLTLRRKKEE